MTRDCPSLRSAMTREVEHDGRTATGTGIGQPVRRREDLRLLTGRGRYSDDVNLPGQAYAVMVRSPHAHALIRGIDTADGARGAGRAGGADGRGCAADGLNPLPNIANTHPADISIQNKDGSPVLRPEQQAIVGPEVCHVGEIVAAVIADERCRRPRMPPSWSRSITRCCRRSRRRSRRRRPEAPRARAEHPEYHPRRRGRRCGGDRGGFRARRACRAVRDLGAAHRRRADGAARRDRRIRPARPGGNTRCMPAPAARSARGATWRSCWACRPSRRAS